MQKDQIYHNSLNNHMITIGFLKTLKDNLSPDDAYNFAKEAFKNYMVHRWSLILADTKPGSQERFDMFRKKHEEIAMNIEYRNVLESSPNLLRVVFFRCPFAEIMNEHGLKELTTTFCLSDFSYTEEVLPGVTLTRNSVIAEGNDCCENIWIYN